MSLSIFRTGLVCNLRALGILLACAAGQAQAQESQPAPDTASAIAADAVPEDAAAAETPDDAVAAETPSAGARSGALEEVVVTGSRVKGAGETGLVPVLIRQRESLDSFGAESAGELLSNLSQAGALEFEESAEGPNSARGDVAAVNLRGLGSGNTLALLNGRRMVQHPFTQDVDQTPRSVVNLNAIPSQAIQRVEVLKDGASALYGADATAGVVNNIVRDDFDGARITTRYSNSVGSGYQSQSANFSLGKFFNDGASHFGVFASLYDRNGIHANERAYSISADKRPLLPPSWAAETDFDNRSTISQWGWFQVGSQAFEGVFRGLDVGAATGGDGRFRIRPEAEGSAAQISTTPARYVDNDAMPDRSLRYDINETRQLSPDIRRFNLFTTWTHDLDNGISVFAEGLLYQSASDSQRAAQPIDIALAALVIPAANYYNPFGPATLADGSPNPRRIDGLPAGSDAGYDVLIHRWRPVGLGPRVVDTDSLSYRILGGLQGTWRDWDWEAAAFWSYAQATDRTANLISKTALLERLSLRTEDAINPFGGVGANSASQYDAVRIGIENEANSALAGMDLRVNRSQWFQLPWTQHGAGVAAGLEWRNEQYDDDRDPRLDGSIVYLDGVGGDRSDIAGISPTSDSDAGRNVHSAYGELLLPLVSDRPAVQRLDFQAAARVERFDDTGDTVFKPKLALAWRPLSFLLFRTAYSEGFRAPNLVQLYRGDVSRLNRGYTDFWRAQAGREDADGGDYRRSVRESNPNLQPEDTETAMLGMRWDVPLWGDTDMVINVDFWHFDQENVIDNFGAEEQLAVDYLLRAQGSENPLVIRATPTADDIVAFVEAGLSPEDAAGRVLYVRDPYINLDPRTVRGIDYALAINIPSERFGKFKIQLDVSRLLQFDQTRVALQPLLRDPVIGADDDIQALRENRIGLDGKPEWRSAGSLTWRRGRWGASWSYNYIGRFEDTSASNDSFGGFWPIDPWLVMNVALDYRFRGLSLLNNARLRVGATNLLDEDPPLADQSRGYFTSFHNNRGRLLYLSLRANL